MDDLAAIFSDIDVKLTLGNFTGICGYAQSQEDATFPSWNSKVLILIHNYGLRHDTHSSFIMESFSEFTTRKRDEIFSSLRIKKIERKNSIRTSWRNPIYGSSITLQNYYEKNKEESGEIVKKI